MKMTLRTKILIIAGTAVLLFGALAWALLTGKISTEVPASILTPTPEQSTSTVISPFATLTTPDAQEAGTPVIERGEEVIIFPGEFHQFKNGVIISVRKEDYRVLYSEPCYDVPSSRNGDTWEIICNFPEGVYFTYSVHQGRAGDVRVSEIIFR